MLRRVFKQGVGREERKSRLSYPESPRPITNTDVENKYGIKMNRNAEILNCVLATCRTMGVKRDRKPWKRPETKTNVNIMRACVDGTDDNGLLKTRVLINRFQEDTVGVYKTFIVFASRQHGAMGRQ